MRCSVWYHAVMLAMVLLRSYMEPPSEASSDSLVPWVLLLLALIGLGANTLMGRQEFGAIALVHVREENLWLRCN